jgi:choline-glycine betaine transporter
VIVTSAPFLVIIAGLAVSFWKELAGDRRAAEQALEDRKFALEHGTGRDAEAVHAGSTTTPSSL